MHEDKVVVVLKNITKSFPGVLALNDISIDFRRGEIHALLGENGAGKSTLIKVLAGFHSPDKGEIQVQDRSYKEMNPRLAKQLGIQVIYQEFNLVPTMSAAENIFLGDFIGNRITIDFKTMLAKTKALFKELGVNIDPRKLVKNMSPAQQQIVEIAKAISKEVKLLIMDEPSAPLTPSEVQAMFKIVENLKQNGVSIVYISHRMEELFQISDRITIMRDGQYIETKQTKDTSRTELINLMVGRELKVAYPSRNIIPTQNVLEVKHLYGNRFEDISFQVKKGEIVGVAGLVGAGRTELARAIFGAEPPYSGELILEGKKISVKSPSDAISVGIGLIPEDRKQQGVLLNNTIKWNISLPNIKSLSRLFVVSNKAETQQAEGYRESLLIKTPTLNQLVKNLSGGNQQKVILAKWLARDCKVLIFDEPTRGIDVGAKQEIYKLMCSLAENGVALIMISSDMEELLGVSDRVIVLHEGKKVGELSKAEFTQNRILELASGSL